MLLGLGAFHPSAPWTLLHEHVPVFRSQHVPSRFLYPAVLVLALVAACGLGRFVQRWRRRRPYLDLVLALLVCAVAIDVALVAQQPMKSAMWMVPPPIPAGRTFHFEHDPPFHYRRRDWAGPMLLSMMANTGVLNCYGVPRTTLVAPGPAHVREPRYRGEAYLLGGEPARVAQWSPNRAVIEVGEHAEGATLVYNMRHRGGWSADHGQVSMHEGMIAVTLPPGVSRVTLRYRPPGLVAGMLLAAATALLLCAAAVAERGWERVR